MTKRINASRFYYGALELSADPDSTPNGFHVYDVLSRLPSYAPILHRDRNIRCYACRILIEPGHTSFAATDHPVAAPVLCYRCGVAWEIHNMRLTPQDADSIPPFGGPIQQRRAAVRKE